MSEHSTSREVPVYYRWPVAIHLEDSGEGREWEQYVVAQSVDQAVQMAILDCALKPNEHVHNIHVGRPRDLVDFPALAPVIDQPNWRSGPTVGNWRTYVPSEVRRLWHELSHDQKQALHDWAATLAKTGA